MRWRRTPQGKTLRRAGGVVTAYLDGALGSAPRRRSASKGTSGPAPDCSAYAAQFAQTINALGALPAEQLREETLAPLLDAFRGYVRERRATGLTPPRPPAAAGAAPGRRAPCTCAVGSTRWLPSVSSSARQVSSADQPSMSRSVMTSRCAWEPLDRGADDVPGLARQKALLGRRQATGARAQRPGRRVVGGKKRSGSTGRSSSAGAATRTGARGPRARRACGRCSRRS